MYIIFICIYTYYSICMYIYIPPVGTVCSIYVLPVGIRTYEGTVCTLGTHGQCSSQGLECETEHEERFSRESAPTHPVQLTQDVHQTLDMGFVNAPNRRLLHPQVGQGALQRSAK